MPRFGKAWDSLGCVRPLLGCPIGCSSPHDPLEGSFLVCPRAPWTPAQGEVSPTTPLGGCYVVVCDTSPAHAKVRGPPNRGFYPHTLLLLILCHCAQELPESRASNHDPPAQSGPRHGVEERAASAAPGAPGSARAMHLFVTFRGLPPLFNVITVVPWTLVSHNVSQPTPLGWPRGRWRAGRRG